MKNSIEELKNKFIEISNKGWIKNEYSGTGGAGNTFEKLIGVANNNYEIPDYEGIEIKTRNAKKNKFITMFCANPDESYLFDTKRLKENYGYPDKENKNHKILNASVNGKNYTRVGLNYYFKIFVNRKQRKIFLHIYNKKCVLIDTDTFWSFDMIEEKIKRKMTYLALISADYKSFNNNVYCRYNKILLYKFKNFDMFLRALELGYIRITFKLSVFRVGKRVGQEYNHGTSFDIEEKNINWIYEEMSI